MKLSAIFAAFAASAVVANPVAKVPAKPEPDPSAVWVESVTYGGSGCPQGSASISLSADRKSFTVILDAYVVSVGPGIGIAEARKNCQLNVQLHYPTGFQYSILSSDYRGYVELEKGVTGTQKANYYFAGSTNQASIETKFKGPISQDYLIHDEIPFTSTVWSPCGEYAGLNINSQVRVENSANSKATGFLTTDSIDGKVTFKVGVQWQEC